MDVKTIIQLIGDVGFPLVLILALVYFGAKYAVPKVVALVEKIVDDFRAEMEREREYHSQNVERFFKVQTDEHKRIEEKIKSEADRVVGEIGRGGGKSSTS